jgi:uncharacterized Rmd1/YagE family protein
MRCTAFCTAYSYHLKPLFESLKSRYVTTLYRDVIHLKLEGTDSCHDIFYFSFGALVCWGTTEEEEMMALREVQAHEDSPIENIEEDDFTIHLSEKNHVHNDELYISDYKLLTRLAVSYGLAQSAKLGGFELLIQKTINDTKQIPIDLATKGKILLSKKEIRCMMGKLFIDRSSVNLHFDALDKPEFFWENDDLEPLYSMTAKYLDVQDRVRALNHRLAIINDLFQMLGNEVDTQHSSRLEIIIIILIMIEVIITVFIEFIRR